MDTQQQMRMVIILLGVAKINVSNLQLLSFMESRQIANIKKQQLLSFKDSRKMSNVKLTENKAR